jgi:hypothetical protein
MRTCPSPYKGPKLFCIIIACFKVFFMRTHPSPNKGPRLFCIITTCLGCFHGCKIRKKVSKGGGALVHYSFVLHGVMENKIERL